MKFERSKFIYSLSRSKFILKTFVQLHSPAALCTWRNASRQYLSFFLGFLKKIDLILALIKFKQESLPELWGVIIKFCDIVGCVNLTGGHFG